MTLVDTILQSYKFATGDLKCPACKDPLRDHYQPISKLKNGICRLKDCNCDHSRGDRDPNNPSPLSGAFDAFKEKISGSSSVVDAVKEKIGLKKADK